MPTTTKKDREDRRAMVAFLDGLGVGPTVIGDVVGVTRQTIHADLGILAKRAAPLSMGQVAAQVRGVAGHLGVVVADMLQATRVVRDEKGRPMQDREGNLLQEPAYGVRLGAARTLWTIFDRRVAVEQTLGTMPKKPEEVSVELEVGKNVQELLDAVLVRLGKEAATEYTGALRSIHVERHKLLERLGFTP